MLTDQKILLALFYQLNMAESWQHERRLLDQLPHYGSPEARSRHEDNKVQNQKLKLAIVMAIAETDYGIEELIALAGQGPYGLAQNFIAMNEYWIEQERSERHRRERIAAERGQEFCLNCGKPSDGSYCDVNCLENHLMPKIELSGLSLEAYVIRHAA